jgi:ABC-type glycerol-3-phosphate transport system substrate-binding protein
MSQFTWRRCGLLLLSLWLVAATAAFAGGKAEAAGVPPTLRLFMGNSGVPHPPGVNPSDNPYINYVKKYAGVNLEVEVPGYEDFATKASLMLASGNIPDVVHSYLLNDMTKAADSGLFLDLTGYYNKSAVMKKLITPEMLGFVKSPSGHNYYMPMRWDAPPGWGNYARSDLVMQYNNGKWPESVDEWIALLRTIKRAIPDSIPITAQTNPNGTFGYGDTLWIYYGVEPFGYPYGSRIQDGKIVPDFILPEYRAAVEMWRTLYSEGILDREYATNDGPKRIQRVLDNSVVLLSDYGGNQILPNIDGVAAQGKPYTFAVTPPLKTYPSVLRDPKYANMVYKPLPVLVGPNFAHGMYVGAGSKYPDKAWKVIEAFATPEFFDLITWGQQGIQYTVANGKRVPNYTALNDPNHTWALHLSILWGFPSYTGSDVKMAAFESRLGAERFKTANDSLAIWKQAAEANGYDRSNFLPPIDEVNKKNGDSTAFIAEATDQAVMGKITMQEFDDRVAQYKTTYQGMYDLLTQQFQQMKDTLLKNGVKSASW